MTKPLEHMPRTLGEMLEYCANTYGTATALKERRDGVWQSVSFARFHKEARALALMLSGRFQAGDRVMILGENSYEWALSFMALTLLGAIPVPADNGGRTKDLTAMAVASGAKGVLYAPSKQAKRRAFVGLSCVCFDKYPALLAKGKRTLAEGDYPAPWHRADPDSMAALFFTPGTTGTAKGVMLSHTNLLATVQNMGSMMTVDAEDVFLSHLPLSHVYECVCGFLAPLYYGATVAFGGGVERLLRDMRDIHPTWMVTIPYFAEALYRKFWAKVRMAENETRVRRFIAVSDPIRPLSARQAMKERLLVSERAFFGGALRRLLILGESMEAAVQKGLRQIGVLAVQGYGMTECAGLAALNRDTHYRDGSAGLAFPDSMLDIYNAQPDGSGEIRYKGKNVMLGYLNDPERTAHALNGEWYHTGDIGRIDEDGFLHILGRRQNCIQTQGGRLICPEELEQLLCQSPFIKEAVVVGVLNPETKDSEAAALILPDDEYIAELLEGAWDEEEIEAAIDDWIAELNAELDLYRQIGQYAICEQPFPKDAAGRYRRHQIAKVFHEMLQES